MTNRTNAKGPYMQASEFKRTTHKAPAGIAGHWCACGSWTAASLAGYPPACWSCSGPLPAVADDTDPRPTQGQRFASLAGEQEQLDHGQDDGPTRSSRLQAIPDTNEDRL